MAQDAPKGTKLEFEVSGKLKGTSVVAAQKGTTVSVENLFNNLPVRRRELERNIKREWNRVVGVLGQYACIQTGIKFSVTQQAGKGKKTTLFSTKGNQSTRENIVNVFGAKTLTALVALDLNLEMEPTSAPSQRWSTQEDGGKKEIRIVGHISRPASGEGRQTPDRQMFFVNARPCGLPQVAKAFNEVYKSYNASQSPFIFANIELDTHLYDVNVSPDKRTIMLHDQTRMLESLKTALTALFESQDYTVPISQLPAQKQPSYKQLTLNRETTETPTVPRAQPPAASTEDEESEDGSKSSRREQSTDSEGPRKPSNPKLKRRAVSRETMSMNNEARNLISNWAGRKAEGRAEKEVDGPEPAAEVSEGLSKEKQKLISKLRKEGERAEIVVEHSPEPDSSVATTQSTIAPATFKPPVPVADFNKRIAEIQRRSESVDREDSPVEPESPIPALHSTPKPPASIADRFTSTARSQRAPAEIATITIGDHTVTSSIGTPCPKRARVEGNSSTSREKGRSQASAAALPSFGSTLSQRFGATGTALQRETSTEDSPASPQVVSSSSSEAGEEAENEASEQDAMDTQSASSVVKEEEAASSSQLPNIEEDGEYIDEAEKKAREEAKVREMIREAENAATLPSQENALRAKVMLKGGSKKKDSTINLVRFMNTSVTKIGQEFTALQKTLSSYQQSSAPKDEDEALDSPQAEEKLSLTISKTDFGKMKIIGQFNLGFILASRASELRPEDGIIADDVFIIDQHASDEKYNFERLQAATIVQSQRLVAPKTLDLTALEEEIVLENLSSLSTNGFVVKVDESGESPVGNRCQLISLPLSRETAFSLTDLEELISLLAENLTGTVPRPSKVRKMFAMRACRSSIMIGKTLTEKQMGSVVKHLGELDKPWNCPHGRPTMRHLCGLGVWDEHGWREGDEPDGTKSGNTDWAVYARQNRGGSMSPEVLE
jgi:DNA mismatch repair protein PMS2